MGAVEVLPGNAGDQEKALELVHQTERVMEAEAKETVGDCARVTPTGCDAKTGTKSSPARMV